MKQRFDALSREISDPDVIADQNRWRELVKEHSQLEPIIAKYDEYTDTQREIEECKEMLAEAGSDRDMKELAESELRELEKKAEQQIGELKVMLLPKDKNDDRNVIMEIRAGTGGDEAALFGAVLLRMYQRYAERHGFKNEIKCTKVIFADDTRWEAEETWQQLPAQVSLSQSIGGDLAGQYRLEVNDKAQFNPQELDELWICSCGCANHHGNGRCVNCGVQKTAVFGSLNQEELRRKYAERTAREQEAAKQKEAANKKRNKLLVIAAAVGVVIMIISSIVSANQPGIKVVRMNEERGSNAVVSSIDYLNHYFQLDFEVTGNFEGTVDLKHRVTYPDGYVSTANWAWEDVKSGETCGVEWDGFANVYGGHGEGTVKIDIINVETNKSIGTIKVRVK